MEQLKQSTSLQNPCPWHNEISFFNKEIERYNRAMETVANNSGVNFISTFSLLEDSDLSDGLHPDSLGHQKIAERIVDTLNKILLEK